MDCIEIIDETKSSAFFDETIGHIQDIVLSERFEKMQNKFHEDYWHHFDYVDENKLEYMDIFVKYQQLFEHAIQEELQQRMKHFDMDRFALELATINGSDTLDIDEIHELLKTFTEFTKFKELMLDYRRKKEGQVAHITDGNILVTVPYAPNLDTTSSG